MYRFLLCCILCLPLAAIAQPTQQSMGYEAQTFKHQEGEMPYRIYYPPGYDGSKLYPMLMFLHGAGERGSDNVAQLTHGAALFASAAVQAKYPCIVVFPQCAASDYWSSVQISKDSAGRRQFQFKDGLAPTRALLMAENLFDSLAQHLKVDTNRMYVGGLSMGAMGTYELVGRHPGWFAAAVAICGGADTVQAVRMTLPRWYIAHGLADAVVPPGFSEAMVRSLQRVGATVTYKFYQGINHDSWTPTFAEPEFLPWLFSSRKEAF